MKNTSITFETAMIAKSRGINLKEYSSSGIITDSSKKGSTNDNDYAWICEQPILQRILREVYNIHIEIHCPDTISNIKNKYSIKVFYIGEIGTKPSVGTSPMFSTYEEALEEGLKQALLLIK